MYIVIFPDKVSSKMLTVDVWLSVSDENGNDLQLYFFSAFLSFPHFLDELAEIIVRHDGSEEGSLGSGVRRLALLLCTLRAQLPPLHLTRLIYKMRLHGTYILGWCAGLSKYT